MRGFGFVRRYMVWALSLGAAWLLASRWLVSALIESAYHERSLPILNRVLSGRDAQPLESYQQAWQAVARQVDFLLVGVATGVFLLLLFRAPTRVRQVFRHLADRSHLGSAPISARDTLLAAASAGLVVGTLTGAFLAYMSFGRGQAVPKFRLVSGDVVWMAPLADLMTFLVLGLLLALLGFAGPRLRSRRWVFFVLLFSLLLPLMLLPGWLYGWSAPLLALGVAYQASLYAAVLWSPRGASRLALVLGALAVIMAVGLQVSRGVSERAAYAALPEPDANAPNVVIVVLDAVRARNMSAYGHGRLTSPEFDRLAEEGVLFDRAIATAPWSLPSHASMLTGRYNFELGTSFLTPLDDTYRTLAEELRDRGYHTIASVGNLIFATPLFGLSRGFVRYRAHPISLGVIVRSSWIGRNVIPYVMRKLGHYQDFARKRASIVNRDILGWVEAAPERPFFAFLNYFDAHAPYLAPPPFDRRFMNPPYRYWWGQAGAAPPETPDEIEEMEIAYDACIAYLDHELDRLLSELERIGQLDNTLLIVTADHGEAFFEHGKIEHGSSLHLEQIRVPLLVRFPGRVPSGVRVADPVSISGIPSTVMDLFGLAEERPVFPGPSFARFWQRADGRSGGEEAVLAEHEPDRSLVTDSWHYIREGTAEEELYDLRVDPLERRDVSGEAGAWEDLLKLRTDLARVLDGKAPAPRLAPSSAPSPSPEPKPKAKPNR